MSTKGSKYCNHKVSFFTLTWFLKSSKTENSAPQIKPPSKNNNKNKNKSWNQSANFTAIEPLSPRIGCMGQVRRRNKPRSGSRASSENSYSHSSSVSSSSSSDSLNSFAASSSPAMVQVDLLRIKRFLSSKVLVVEMDPPRPVENKNASGENSACLWKRRQCRGGEVLELQLQLQPSQAN